jgi:hypothetical protein
MAMTILGRHGDPERGEWLENSPIAVHVRRRLSDIEESKIGPAIDVRGTDEGIKRFARAAIWAPLDMIVEEMGSRAL